MQVKAVVKKDKMRKLRLRLSRLTDAAVQSVPYGCPEDVVAQLRDIDAQLLPLERAAAEAAAEEMQAKVDAARAKADELEAELSGVRNVSITTGPPEDIDVRGNPPT